MDDPWVILSLSLPEKFKIKKRKKHCVACGRCGRPMNLRGSHYICSDAKCKGKHRAHTDGTPTGIPGNQTTAKFRSQAHQIFDKLWQSGRVNRSQAYTILKRIMGMTIEEAHIGRFTLDQCRFLIARLDELGDKVYECPYNTSGFLSASEQENQ